MRPIRSVLMSSSEERIQALIDERLKPGANIDLIDKKIWDLFGETWAVMFTDLSGFTEKVKRFGIIHFLQEIYESERIFAPIIDEHQGILLKTEGDSLLIIFRNVRKAVQCAVKMQKNLESYNIEKNDDEKIFLCLGIGYGNMLRIGDSDVFGEEVNSASKLGEDIAGPKDILVTESVKAIVDSEGKYSFTNLEELPAGIKKAYKLIY